MADVNWGKQPNIDAEKLDTTLPPAAQQVLEGLKGYTRAVKTTVGLHLARYRLWRKVSDNQLAAAEHRELLRRLALDLRKLTGTKGNPGLLRRLPTSDRFELTNGIFEASELWGDPVETLVNRLESFADSCNSMASGLDGASSRWGGKGLEQQLLSQVAEVLEQQLGMKKIPAADNAHKVLKDCGIEIGEDNPRRIVRNFRKRMQGQTNPSIDL